jgi:hypothetical protein
MRLIEFEDHGEDPNKLLGLVQFLHGRADDTDATKQISQDAFINLAQSLGINITKQNLAQIVGSPPLSSVLEPLDAQSNMVTYKGADIGPSKMSVPQAQATVDRMAKSAMKRGLAK